MSVGRYIIGSDKLADWQTGRLADWQTGRLRVQYACVGYVSDVRDVRCTVQYVCMKYLYVYSTSDVR